MPVVQIITTGGTIASRIDPATGAAFPVMRATELVAQIPELSKHAQVGVDEFGLVPSWDMTPATVLRLARTIRSTLAAGDVDGVVVTHGTDTMEESAFALDLLFDGEQPVVITGAMRNASQPGSVGPRNLLSAVRVAASINTRGLGVAVVMNDQMHAPRYVTKSHTTATDTMISPGVGPIGTVDDSGVWLRWRPARLPRMPLVEPEPRVYLVRMAAGMDDLFLRVLHRERARGVEERASATAGVRNARGADLALRPWPRRTDLQRRSGRSHTAEDGCDSGRRSVGSQGANRTDVRIGRGLGVRSDNVVLRARRRR